MKTLLIGLLVLSSFSTFATTPQQLSCNYNSSEDYKTFKFKLADYTNESGDVELNQEIKVESKTISVSLLSTSGTMVISLLETRGVYTENDICAGGGCPVGAPKMGAILQSLTSWEMGKSAMANSYASPKQGTFYRIDCYLENI